MDLSYMSEEEQIMFAMEQSRRDEERRVNRTCPAISLKFEAFSHPQHLDLPLLPK
jgi:hypothetical protein